MKTFIFDTSAANTQQSILNDLGIINEQSSNKSEFAQLGLGVIAHHKTDGDYKNDYFYLKALAEKLLEKIDRSE